MSGTSSPLKLIPFPYFKVGVSDKPMEQGGYLFSTHPIKKKLWQAALADEHRLHQQRKSSVWYRYFSSRDSSPNDTLLCLRSILGNEGRVLAETLFHLAQYNVQHDTHPALTQKILEFTSKQPNLQKPSQSLLKVTQGGGSFFEKLGYQLPRLGRELFSPLNLVPFGIASATGKLASSAILSRATRGTVATFLVSEVAAWGAEVPALVISRRVGMHLFVGGKDLFKPGSLGKEMLATYGPFGLFRISQHLSHWLSPSLQQVHLLKKSNGQLNRVGTLFQNSIRFSSDLSAVMAGHAINQAIGLSLPEYTKGFDALFGAILTVGEIHLTGKIVDAMLGRHLRKIDWKNHLTWKRLQENGAFQLRTTELALAGGMKGWERPALMATDSNGSGSGRGGKTISLRANLILELAKKNLAKYLEVTENQDSIMRQAAQGLKDLLDRWKRDPTSIQDPRFADQLEEIENQLRVVNNTQTKTIPRLVGFLKVLMKHREALQQEPILFEELENGSIEKEVARRARLVVALHRLQLSIKHIRQRGLTTRLRGMLLEVTGQLNRFWNKKIWSPPHSIFPLVSKKEAQRREGALLGLSTNNQSLGQNSFLAYKLHSEAQLNLFTPDPELELLHQTILLTTTHITQKIEDLLPSVIQLARQYQASDETTSAMSIMAEALDRSFKTGESLTPWVLTLADHSHAAPLLTRLLNLNSFKNLDIAFEDSFPFLAPQPLAADYLISGLMVLIRANGDPRSLVWSLRGAAMANAPGFHPSIPLSLFGAIYGRRKLPANLVLTKKPAEQFLERALRESQKISDK